MVSRRHRSLSVVLVLALAVFTLGCDDDTLPTGPGGTDKDKVLPVYYMKHMVSDWAWAAATSMVLVYYSGANIPQCILATARTMDPTADCCTTPSDQCLGIPTTSEIVDLLNSGLTVGDVGGSGGSEDDYNPFPTTLSFSATASGPLSQAEVYAAIDAGRPIIMRLEGVDPTELFAVIYGYYADGDLYIFDTAAGQVRAPYGTTFNYGGPNPTTWVDTILISPS